MPIPSTVPGVIDGLLQKFSEIDYLFDSKPLEVEVFDGFPVNQPPVFVMVGGLEEPTAEGTGEWAGFAPFYMYEDYEVNCSVFAATGGTGDTGVDPADVNASASDAQRTVRQQAYAVHSQIVAAVLADIPFRNVASPVQGLTWVRPTARLSVQQTSPDDENSAAGRSIQIAFSFHAKGRIGGP